MTRGEANKVIEAALGHQLATLKTLRIFSTIYL